MKLNYRIATKEDIPFLKDIYDKNINALHGIIQDESIWEKKLMDTNSTYYILKNIAWFKVSIQNTILWLDMLQIDPKYQHQGYGTYILNIIEKIAITQNILKVGIHTTEDNIPAKNLYMKNNYQIIEYGECTTADGIIRKGYTFTKKI